MAAPLGESPRWPQVSSSAEGMRVGPGMGPNPRKLDLRPLGPFLCSGGSRYMWLGPGLGRGPQELRGGVERLG
jgi:hypothetical protein